MFFPSMNYKIRKKFVYVSSFHLNLYFFNEIIYFKQLTTHLLSRSEGHYVTKRLFIRFRLLEAIFLFLFIPWNLLMRKIMSVKFFRGLGLSKVMTSYLTVSELFFLQNMTLYHWKGNLMLINF